jgi:hypothetical protein
MADDLELKIGKMTLGPADVLVVKVSTRLTYEQHRELCKRVKSLLAPGMRFMVVNDDVELSVVQMADIPPEQIPEQVMTRKTGKTGKTAQHASK